MSTMPVVDAIGLLRLRKVRHWFSLRRRRPSLSALFLSPSLHIVCLYFPCPRSILGLVYVSRSPLPPSSRYCIRGLESLSHAPFYFPLSIYLFSLSRFRKSSLIVRISCPSIPHIPGFPQQHLTLRPCRGTRGPSKNASQFFPINSPSDPTTNNGWNG